MDHKKDNVPTIREQPVETDESKIVIDGKIVIDEKNNLESRNSKQQRQSINLDALYISK